MLAVASRRMFSRISLTSMLWALWLMEATMARIVAMPRTTATITDRLGMTGSPPSSSGDRTDRMTITQYVNVPTTRAMTRLLNGSRNMVWTTRGEYWLDASWMMSRETEKAMPAKAMVAPAMVLNKARALSTVEVSPKGSRPVARSLT